MTLALVFGQEFGDDDMIWDCYDSLVNANPREG